MSTQITIRGELLQDPGTVKNSFQLARNGTPVLELFAGTDLKAISSKLPISWQTRYLSNGGGIGVNAGYDPTVLTEVFGSQPHIQCTVTGEEVLVRRGGFTLVAPGAERIRVALNRPQVVQIVRNPRAEVSFSIDPNCVGTRLLVDNLSG